LYGLPSQEVGSFGQKRFAGALSMASLNDMGTWQVSKLWCQGFLCQRNAVWITHGFSTTQSVR